MTNFVTVGSVDQLPPGGVLRCVVEDQEVAVFNCDGVLYAISNICSHAYEHLSEGELDTDECTIECPLHGAIFSLQTGKPHTLPATVPVPTYAARIVDDAVQVAVS